MNKFKVGDWVRVTLVHNKSHSFIVKYSNIWNQPEYYTKELWKPKQGELCWFKSASNSAEFGEYVGKTEYGKYQMRPNGVTCIFNYSYCEPFIGTLPSFITR